MEQHEVTIYTHFRLVQGRCICVDCMRNGLPFINSGLIGITLSTYLSSLDLVIDDCLSYAIFETAECRIKFRKFGGSYFIYTTYKNVQDSPF